MNSCKMFKICWLLKTKFASVLENAHGGNIRHIMNKANEDIFPLIKHKKTTGLKRTSAAFPYSLHIVI